MKKFIALFFVVLVAVSAAFVGCKKAEAPAEEAAPAAEEAAPAEEAAK